MAHRPKRPSDHSAVYVISVVSELLGMHPQTLRQYERKGLLDPQRTEGNSRRYSDKDLDQLRRIQELTNDGVNLAGVRAVIELERKLERMQTQLERAHSQIEQLHQRIVEAERALRRERSTRRVPVRLSDVRNIFERGR